MKANMTKRLTAFAEKYELRDAIFPLCFVIGGMVNLILFYLGFAYVSNPIRTYGFIAGILLFDLVAFFVLIKALKNNPLQKRNWILLAAVCIFFAACFAAAFLKFGKTSVWMDFAKQFICFCVPAFFAGICGALFRTEKKFFVILEKVSFFVLPAVILYVNGAVFNCSGFLEIRGLGVMGYMVLADLFMPFLLSHLICFAEKSALPVPFVKKKILHPQVWRTILIALYWIAIIASGTRGIYICVLCVCILLVISLLIHRKKVKGTFFVCAAMAALLLFNAFVYAPPGMWAAGRLSEFVSGLQEGQIVTSNENKDVSDHVDDLVQMDGGQQITNQPAETLEPDGEQESTPPSDETPAGEGEQQSTPPSDETPAGEGEQQSTPPSDETPAGEGEQQSTSPSDETPAGEGEQQSTSPSDKTPAGEGDDSGKETLSNLRIGNRGTLFKLAIKEFLKSPLTGMGPTGFTVKYGLYPHNVLLELLCETGLLGFIPMLALVLYAIIKLLRIGWKDEKVRYIVLFLLAFAVQANISDSIWQCEPLLAALGYAIAYRRPAPSEITAERNTEQIET